MDRLAVLASTLDGYSMIAIRAEQMRRFRDDARAAYLSRLAAHLRARFSRQLATATPDELMHFVEATSLRAEAQGMRSKDQIRRFAETVLAARGGLEESAEPEGLGRILDEDGLGPRQKLTALEDWLLYEAGR